MAPNSDDEGALSDDSDKTVTPKSNEGKEATVDRQPLAPMELDDDGRATFEQLLNAFPLPPSRNPERIRRVARGPGVFSPPVSDRWDPPPYPNERGIKSLTDNPLDINETGDIDLFSDRPDPNINPVPPQVRKEYWARLYRRAGSMIYEDVENEVVAEMAAEQSQSPSPGGVPITGMRRMSLAEQQYQYQAKLKERKRRIKEKMKFLKENWELWRMALKLMIRDIVLCDVQSGGGEEGALRRRTLRETRNNDPFFDFMEALPGCATCPADFVPEDARGWYGTGLWMTQMELD
ncbi:hypothetical protein QBC34DRAFT_495575 [Podospora aff. communis PSN243]|uniref:BZIP domain-containing protein n=1 Tax=Podospora aff. communis PSN243 TaxID=3040156 RepID=A0AAV9GKX3_9PEZI|nr:hypothetical protein QBC34DRAFT_495575 [Podospora aff. communis PSN243]